jgi:hypothetical protein
MEQYPNVHHVGVQGEWDSKIPENAHSTTCRATDGNFGHGKHCKAVLTAGERQVGIRVNPRKSTEIKPTYAKTPPKPWNKKTKRRSEVLTFMRVLLGSLLLT